MSALDRALGIARSLIVYHGIPGRQRRMRRLYARFVRKGDHAFDVGAHAGNRARALASLGCRVVAIEPQPDFARLLRTLFARTSAVSVVEAAAGRATGRAALAISDRTPTVTTLSSLWREARSGDEDFAGVNWNRSVEVTITTLDALIAQYGMPSFAKIDVEGSELEVLAGLSQPVQVVSFEYLTRALDSVEACTTRLSELGDYHFTWSGAESFRLETEPHLTARELITSLGASSARQQFGDVYAVLSSFRTPSRRPT
jgi:FkbM family methyltransferase